MHYNTGYPREAAGMMRHFLRVFDQAETVCVPSGSCVAMIREHFPKMAEDSGDHGVRRAVEELLPRVWEFSELLVDKLGVTDTGARFAHSVTLHTTCHSLRGLKIGDRPVRLLERVRGLRYIPLAAADQCCGFGGTFAIKNPEVSTAMLGDKMGSVLETGAEVLTAVDNSCLMHIGGGLSRQHAPVRCLHLAEILAAQEGEGEGGQ
jgi:L-lactate dehydrogenase complex protein LldE